MKKEDIILIAEDDKRHFELIRKNLLRAGIHNKMLCLANGQEIFDFLFDMDKEGKEKYYKQDYILLLDLGIPGVDGVEVLEKIKQDTNLKKIPVIILAAADAPDIIERCHNLGCSTYIVKPVNNEDFEKTIQKIGHFLSIVEITSIR